MARCFYVVSNPVAIAPLESSNPPPSVSLHFSGEPFNSWKPCSLSLMSDLDTTCELVVGEMEMDRDLELPLPPLDRIGSSTVPHSTASSNFQPWGADKFYSNS